MFFKTYIIERGGYEITIEDSWIELDRALWYMLGRSMWNNHHNMFKENIYYVWNDIKKLLNMAIIEYAEHMREMFELTKLITPTSNNSKYYHKENWDTRKMP